MDKIFWTLTFSLMTAVLQAEESEVLSRDEYVVALHDRYRSELLDNMFVIDRLSEVSSKDEKIASLMKWCRTNVRLSIHRLDSVRELAVSRQMRYDNWVKERVLDNKGKVQNYSRAIRENPGMYLGDRPLLESSSKIIDILIEKGHALNESIEK